MSGDFGINLLSEHGGKLANNVPNLVDGVKAGQDDLAEVGENARKMVFKLKNALACAAVEHDIFLHGAAELGVIGSAIFAGLAPFCPP